MMSVRTAEEAVTRLLDAAASEEENFETAHQVASWLWWEVAHDRLTSTSSRSELRAHGAQPLLTVRPSFNITKNGQEETVAKQIGAVIHDQLTGSKTSQVCPDIPGDLSPRSRWAEEFSEILLLELDRRNKDLRLEVLRAEAAARQKM